MTVFSLLIYSCVSLNGFDGELLQKTCTWSDAGGSSLYAQLQNCEADGKKHIGSPIFSDVADGRHVEKTKCQPLSVQ